MINKSFPILLEDRTGLYTESDFDDIYDRIFLRIGQIPSKLIISGFDESTIGVWNVGRRSSNQRDYRSFQREPAIVLQFGPAASLGKITFVESSMTIPMNQYLKRTAMFAG